MPPALPTTFKRVRANLRRVVLGTVVASTLSAGILVAATPASAGPIYSNGPYAMAVFAKLNAQRAAHHLPALRMDNRLNYSAYYHNIAMKNRNLMSHQVPGEASLGPRILARGYRYSYAGENIGWNSAMSAAGAVQLENIMYAERAPNNGHLLNILNRSYTNVGVNVVVDSAHHKIWLSVDFGRPR